MTKTYELTKLSNKSFVLATEDLDLIYNTLWSYICMDCTEDIGDELRDVEINTQDKIDMLLGTACGCEFMLDEFDSWDMWTESLVGGE